MVKLRGPGLAQGAAGSIGGALVFSNWRGRSYAKKLTIPKQPRPIEQVASRAVLAFLTTQWSGIDPFLQFTWASTDLDTQLDPYHNYIAQNVRTWHTGQAPSNRYPQTRSLILPTWTGWTATAQGRRAEIAYNVNALNNAWGVILLRHTASLYPPHFNYTVQLTPLTSTGWHYTWDGPLAPATYRYRFHDFTIDGKLSAAHSQKTVVIT